MNIVHTILNKLRNIDEEAIWNAVDRAIAAYNKIEEPLAIVCSAILFYLCVILLAAKLQTLMR